MSSPPSPRVLLANISRGSISTATTIGVINALTTGRAVSVLFVESGPYLDAGRNKVIANSRRVTVEGTRDLPHDLPLAWDWLLFVDSDIEFSGDDITQLLVPYAESDALDPLACPVISGVYINPFDDGGVPGDEADPNGHPGHFGPVVYEWVERDDLPGQLHGVPTPTFRRLSRKALEEAEGWRHESDPVCEVSAVGAGFLAIHSSLIDVMEVAYPEPMVWFDEPIVNGVHMGEDFGFCHRVTTMGYPVLVNRACAVLHHKTTKLV